MDFYTSVLKIVLIILTIINYVITIEDSNYWKKIANDELKESLSYKWNENIAKNVILFIGDGMSIDTATASRIYRAGETSNLAWEKLPHVGLIKTYNTNKKVADSASTATALFSGVKTNYNVVGVDSHVQLNDCDASLNPKFHVSSIIEWAQEAGKDTGFVTTTRVTHATPAPLYAHSPNRKWECENEIPETSKKCKDIAKQLIENTPGKNIKVIMGGGRQMLQSNVSGTEIDPIDTWACYSTDGRDLINDWVQDKKLRNFSYKVVQNNKELRSLDPTNIEFLLGIFANGHLRMDWERVDSSEGQPSLEEMTKMAIKVLEKSSKGYLLVVEGGLIDYAHHRGHAAQALRETVRLSDAVNATINAVDLSDTLIIVTSDHSHSMSFNGYSDRNNSILGIAQSSKYDGIPFTTLSYSTGGVNNKAYTVIDGEAVRIDPRDSDTLHFNYSQQAGIITDEAYHGGGDVAIYAKGPFAHLIHSTHEQNYIAYVIGYASRIGPYFTSSANQYFDRKWSVLIIISNISCVILYQL
ncbi:alkaline phosphatase-like [Chelonus insularis]|uniref:alkaline phosphatase-like n=1 Tax=Chelonus insularis TaxID=460826 RepID=UPI00158F64EA|nr:alkaline phosphatase-like [Chelonus insularis]XP_034951621.1 alkaline phosphatase-like [Chelonus insularis]